MGFLSSILTDGKGLKLKAEIGAGHQALEEDGSRRLRPTRGLGWSPYLKSSEEGTILAFRSGSLMSLSSGYIGRWMRL